MSGLFARLWRVSSIALSGLIVAGGFWLAARGGEAPAAAVDTAPQPTFAPSATPSPERQPPGPTPAAPTLPPTVAAEASPAPTAAAAVSAAVGVLMKPTATTASAPAEPINDTPRFRDFDVLARSAAAVVPSGKTFRECVETPGDAWPFPVHLYYEGRGRWLVETHLQEVQVVFDEATETFTTRNFAPPNPGCF